MQYDQHSFEFTAEDASTLLRFETVYPTGPGGPVLDNVNVVRVIENFSLDSSRDVLDFSGLVPGDGTAFTGGYLDFVYDGTDTTVLYDADGGGDDYTPIVELVGVQLLETDATNFTW